MALVHGKPFLCYLLDHLASFSINEIILSIGYKGHIIQKYFGNSYGPLKIQYSLETEPLGTGGAIKNSLALSYSYPTLILNGDTFCSINYKTMLEKHRNLNSDLTMALCKMEDTSRYGKVEIDGDKIVFFSEKKKSGPGWINTGVYLMSPSIFDLFTLPQIFSIENDFFIPYLPKLNPHAFFTDKSFIDIGTPADYQNAEAFFSV